MWLILANHSGLFQRSYATLKFIFLTSVSVKACNTSEEEMPMIKLLYIRYILDFELLEYTEQNDSKTYEEFATRLLRQNC